MFKVIFGELAKGDDGVGDDVEFNRCKVTGGWRINFGLVGVAICVGTYFRMRNQLIFQCRVYSQVFADSTLSACLESGGYQTIRIMCLQSFKSSQTFDGSAWFL